MLWIWIGFIVFVLGLLALDLGVFHRKDHVIKTREALARSAVWISIALLFSVFIYFAYQNHWLGLGSAPDLIDGEINHGRQAVLKYITGYAIEKSLSIDNIFVLAILFLFFAVPPKYQHRVLFWGILGAILMRGIMIYVGSELVKYHWVIWLFGGFLVLTGIKMVVAKEKASDPGKNPVVKLVRKLLPVTSEYHGNRFIIRQAGRLTLTPLALALVLAETTDLIFAVDSIPAIFAITADPFLVFTSNIFAILGLRSLYFALAGMMHQFRYLKVSLGVVLVVVGIKMPASAWLEHHLGENFNFYLLGLVFVILGAGIAASLRANRREARLALRSASSAQSAPV
jgi:tellurite resistance protein TerC